MKNLLALILLLAFLSPAFSQDLTTLLATADSLYEALAYPQAIKAYDAFLAHDSSQAEAFHHRGTCFLNEGMHAVAAKDFRQAIRLDPSYPNPHYNLAEVLEHQQDLPGALQHFKRFSELEPTDPDGFMRMGFLYAQAEQPDSLFWCIERAYEIDSSEWRILLSGAGGYFSFGELEKAEKMAVRGQALHPEREEFYSLLADIYKEMDQYDKVVASFEKAINQFPAESRWHNEKASTQLLANTKPAVLVDGKRSSKRFLNIFSENTPQLDKWSQDPAHLYHFNTLKNRFETAAETMSLDEYFMLYYGKSLQDGYSSFNFISKTLKEEITGEDYKKDLETVLAFQKDDPYNPELYYFEAVCHYELKDLPAFGRAIGHYYGFMLGMLYTGDGEMFESAYIVINPHDEYLIMDLLGLDVMAQSLLNHNGHTYDTLKGASEDGEMPAEIYFNIDKHFASLSNMFGGDSNKGKKKKKKRRKK